MFSAKFFALFVALLGFVNFAVATPPACLLDVIGAQPDPSDIETICNKKSIPSDISSKCDAQKSAAMSAYASVCKDAGVTVATSLSASASATKSSSASASASATGSPTASGSSVSTPGASAGSSSGSSSASSTAGAASSTPAPSNDGQRKLVGLVSLGAFAFGAATILFL